MGEKLNAFSLSFDWPTFPLETPLGKPSKAKTAGKLIPWLSANVVNNLDRHMHAKLRGMWRNAVAAAAAGQTVSDYHRLTLEVALFRRRGYNMDIGAIIEGVKPCLDGLVQAGVIFDDNAAVVQSVSGTCTKTVGEPYVLLRLSR